MRRLLSRRSFATAPAKSVQSIESKYWTSAPGVYVAPAKKSRDVIVIGGGHNGLISAAYLSKAGLDTLVLERRHLVGGAAVTEEIIPGFKFSRASYLAGLLRPKIIEDLQLAKYGFKYLPRNPSSFTPTKLDSIYKGKYLLLGDDAQENWRSIAQFSKRDADAYPKYEEFLGKIREIMQPLLDNAPPDLTQGQMREKLRTLSTIKELVKVGYKNKEVLVPFYELLTGPAEQILDRWFESDILKTTLATDAVIGALVGPQQNGSAYVLLHHVMGEAAGKQGVWAYVEGGMGALSNAVASSARSHGTEIVTNATVQKILTKETHTSKGTTSKVVGVRMQDGSELFANTVISATSPYHTFMELMGGSESTAEHKNATVGSSGHASRGYSPALPEEFAHHIKHTDFSCGALKINCAVSRLPNFECYPSTSLKPGSVEVAVGPMHMGTVHFECEMVELVNAYQEAIFRRPASRPVVEMTIPSAVDKTLVSADHPGCHVVQFFVQFAPYDIDPAHGSWADEKFKNAFADRVFSIVDEFCPGFSSSVIGRDIVTPLDLERIFALHKGNIAHASLGIHQLGFARPMSGYSSHRSPVQGLYMGSCGTHPGGGVMGASGKNCANAVLSDLNIS